ncbi:MAG TPA: 3-deoxy-7-phosphoheptulonate synthase AroG [Candidatus Acidoferrales bacterium]|nr:3-deoxy-7-phosphoheptulonate synthase AroG [Candidatus Acidoferrales bacterium]
MTNGFSRGLQAAHSTDDVRILELKELVAPAELIDDIPCSEPVAELVFATRGRLHEILHGRDDRLIVVVGPCSIHDPRSALEYARRLVEARLAHAGELEVVMRVYFEKPRTTVGWKGLINDPKMDDSYAINDGLRIARQLLLDINALGLPAGGEFLDTITPQYLADLISWGAIGARTTESQVHRELASGLSCPVGFKNGTDGNIQIAIDAIKAARKPHHFLSVTKSGRSAIVSTAGNDDCHVILRGGKHPNYDAASVQHVVRQMQKAGLVPAVTIDASHGNSQKDHERQLAVCADIAGQIAAGDRSIIGVMIESHLVAGRQDLKPGVPLVYGQSVTDACLGWEPTLEALRALATGVEERRRMAQTTTLT